MAYEKKIEPLRRYEVFIMAFCLQMFIILFGLIPRIVWGSDNCHDTILEADISSESDLNDVHDCFIEHRSGFLARATCFLLGYPLIIGHIFYTKRLEETLFSFLHAGLMINLYCVSWFIGATIICTVIPALNIFVAYYDWELADTYQQLGYAMQLQFVRFDQICMYLSYLYMHCIH